MVSLCCLAMTKTMTVTATAPNTIRIADGVDTLQVKMNSSKIHTDAMNATVRMRRFMRSILF